MEILQLFEAVVKTDNVCIIVLMYKNKACNHGKLS